MTYTTIKPVLSYNTKNALVKGIIIGTVTALSYLMVVVITTPNLQASSAIDASIRANSGIIFGLGIGMGVQVFISTYSKNLGCKTDKKKLGLLGGGAGSTALGSFFSFFSLIPLGCCGSWLFILSILPTILGSGLSVVLIQHSETLSYLGLGMVFGFTGLSAIRLRREMQLTNSAKYGRLTRLSDNHPAESKKESEKKEFDLWK
jgi:hypothetical protein